MGHAGLYLYRFPLTKDGYPFYHRGQTGSGCPGVALPRIVNAAILDQRLNLRQE
jgi:hypothetical protein